MMGGMAAPGTSAAPASADESSSRRWAQLLGSLVALLPDGAASVLVDGPAERAAVFAGRLSAALDANYPSRTPLVQLAADRPAPTHVLPATAYLPPTAEVPSAAEGGSPDVTIFLRTAPGGQHTPGYRKAGEAEPEHAQGPERPEVPGYPEGRAPRPDDQRREREERADIVIDLHDLDWPVIRRVDDALAARDTWYLTETRAFFACRAATWDTKFGDDLPAYRAAVAEAGIRPGGVAIDVGCGTGRALSPLRAAVGPTGTVIALDVTPEMLAAACPAASTANATRVIADARALPLADRCADAIFAAGLVNHLPDTTAGLTELARVTRPGGLLVLFHPSGRAALAARHGRALSPHEPLAETPLRRFTAATGWHLTAYEDAPHRFFAVAERRLA